MGLATPEGCVSSSSTPGARRRYQRSVPSVMARIAARSGAFARRSSAAFAERPHLITSSTARAAPASAGAPGAQAVLTKLPPGEGHTVRVVADGHPLASGALDLGHTQAATTTANAHEAIVYGDDRARIGAFIAFYWIVLARGGGLCQRRQDTQRLPVQCRLGHRPGIEGADLALDLQGVAAPVDARLRLFDPGCIRDALGGLRAGREAGGQSIERREERRGAQARERLVERAAGVAPGTGEAAPPQPPARGPDPGPPPG